MILAHDARLVKLTGDATERRVQFGADPVHGGDDDDGDADGDQGILNGGGARLLLHKTRNEGLHYFVRSLDNTCSPACDPRMVRILQDIIDWNS